MSQDESLRLAAEVVDKFSGPLKNLSAQLRGMGREGAAGNEMLRSTFGKTEAAMHGVARTATVVVNPALASIGVTSLSTTAALMGVGAALRSFGNSGAALGQLSRETSMAAQELRNFQALSGKFGITGDAAQGAAKTFSQSMRDIRKGYGETMGWLMSQSPPVAEFAIKLKNTKNNDEALKLVEDFMEQIPNAVDRGRFAEKLLGSQDFGRLGDKHLGSIKKLREEIDKNLGPLDPKTIESAERFDKAMADLRSSMNKLGVTISTELMPGAEKVITFLDEVVKGNRKDLTEGIRQSLRELGEEIAKVNWEQFGKNAADALRQSGSLVKAMRDQIKEISEFLNALMEGRYMEAGRRVLGADGPVARALAPMEGDDVKAAEEDVIGKRSVLDSAKDAQKYAFGRGQAALGLLPTPEQAQKDLEAAEARLQALKARTPNQVKQDVEKQAQATREAPVLERMEGINKRLQNYDAQAGAGLLGEKSTAQADALRDELRRLTDELRALREQQSQTKRDGELKAEKSAFEDDDDGKPNSLIQKASLGRATGAYRVRQMLQDGRGGIYAPGGYGRGTDGHGLPRVETAPDNPLMRRNFGSAGRFGGLGGAVPRVQTAPGGPGERVGKALRGEGTKGSAATGEMMAYAMDQLRKEGVPEDHLRHAAAHLVGQAKMESGLDPNKTHDNGTGYGIYGARDPHGWGDYKGARRSAMVKWLEANGYARNSAEGQMRYMAKEAMGGGYPETKRVLMGQGSGNVERDTNAITGEFEAPKVINQRSHAVEEAMRIGPQKPEASTSQPPTGGVGGVDEMQGRLARTRTQGITPELRDQIAYAGTQAGVNAEIYSGGQDDHGPNRTGSHRHDHGRSADLKLYRTDAQGRRQYLAMNDADDQKVMEAFMRHSVHAGATGVGAAPGYMGVNSMHIGGGSSAYWGEGESSAGAPEWVRRAHAEGTAARERARVDLEAWRKAQAASAATQGEAPKITGYDWAKNSRVQRVDDIGSDRLRIQPKGKGPAIIAAKPAAEMPDLSAFSADFRRRQAEADTMRESMLPRQGEPSLLQRALKSGAMGGPKIENNGSVTTIIEKAGPDAKVRTKTTGNLFKEVRLNRGKAMAQASEVA